MLIDIERPITKDVAEENYPYLAVREVRVVDRRSLRTFARLVDFAEMFINQSSTIHDPLTRS